MALLPAHLQQRSQYQSKEQVSFFSFTSGLVICNFLVQVQKRTRRPSVRRKKNKGDTLVIVGNQRVFMGPDESIMSVLARHVKDTLKLRTTGGKPLKAHTTLRHLGLAGVALCSLQELNKGLQGGVRTVRPMIHLLLAPFLLQACNFTVTDSRCTYALL